MPFRSLYEQYGNNEPYSASEYDDVLDPRDPRNMVRLMTGPSTNIYVGPEETHFTIPKRLLYRFSAYAKKCLEGPFFEASANAIWLRDVRPDVFRWLLRWLLTGRLDGDDVEEFWGKDGYRDACALLCEMHLLGERLLCIAWFLDDVRAKMSAVIKEAKRDQRSGLWMADMMHQVLLSSAPVRWDGLGWSSENPSLRFPFLQMMCDVDICTTINFLDCGESIRLDVGFAAELMVYMADELKWAVELWGAQTQSSVNVANKKLQDAHESGESQTLTKRPKENLGRWLALRYICTYVGCTTTDFRAYRKCFELDGSFAAEILDFMGTELRWVVERWSEERGPRVDVMQEKEDESEVEYGYYERDRRYQRYIERR